jgi:hypothetical protein
LRGQLGNQLAADSFGNFDVIVSAQVLAVGHDVTALIKRDNLDRAIERGHQLPSPTGSFSFQAIQPSQGLCLFETPGCTAAAWYGLKRSRDHSEATESRNFIMAPAGQILKPSDIADRASIERVIKVRDGS